MFLLCVCHRRLHTRLASGSAKHEVHRAHTGGSCVGAGAFFSHFAAQHTGTALQLNCAAPTRGNWRTFGDVLVADGAGTINGVYVVAPPPAPPLVSPSARDALTIARLHHPSTVATTAGTTGMGQWERWSRGCELWLCVR